LRNRKTNRRKKMKGGAEGSGDLSLTYETTNIKREETVVSVKVAEQVEGAKHATYIVKVWGPSEIDDYLTKNDAAKDLRTNATKFSNMQNAATVGQSGANKGNRSNLVKLLTTLLEQTGSAREWLEKESNPVTTVFRRYDEFNTLRNELSKVFRTERSWEESAPWPKKHLMSAHAARKLPLLSPQIEKLDAEADERAPKLQEWLQGMLYAELPVQAELELGLAKDRLKTLVAAQAPDPRRPWDDNEDRALEIYYGQHAVEMFRAGNDGRLKGYKQAEYEPDGGTWEKMATRLNKGLRQDIALPAGSLKGSKVQFDLQGPDHGASDTVAAVAPAKPGREEAPRGKGILGEVIVPAKVPSSGIITVVHPPSTLRSYDGKTGKLTPLPTWIHRDRTATEVKDRWALLQVKKEKDHLKRKTEDGSRPIRHRLMKIWMNFFGLQATKGGVSNPLHEKKTQG